MAEFTVNFEGKISGRLVEVEADNKTQAKEEAMNIIDNYLQDNCGQLEDYAVTYTASKWDVELVRGGDFMLNVEVIGSQIDAEGLENALRDVLANYADDISVDVEDI